MAKQKQESAGLKEFLREYKAAQSHEKEKPINTSKYSLEQQLERFNNFSHTEDECEMMHEEIRTL